MKTQQLYYSQPYLTTTTATVLSAEPKGALINVILDNTIFYPEGGGQPSDKGTLGAAKVEYVRVIENELVHQVKGNVTVGELVVCSLNWAWRHKHMRLHTAGHLIHDVLMPLAPNLVPIAGSHGQKAYVEYLGSFDATQAAVLEARVNDYVGQDLSVVTREVSFEELVQNCKFVPAGLPKTKQLRMLKIGNFDWMPDGGVQVKSTGEVGKIKIISITNAGGKTTIRYGIVG